MHLDPERLVQDAINAWHRRQKFVSMLRTVRLERERAGIYYTDEQVERGALDDEVLRRLSDPPRC